MMNTLKPSKISTMLERFVIAIFLSIVAIPYNTYAHGAEGAWILMLLMLFPTVSFLSSIIYLYKKLRDIPKMRKYFLIKVFGYAILAQLIIYWCFWYILGTLWDILSWQNVRKADSIVVGSMLPIYAVVSVLFLRWLNQTIHFFYADDNKK